MRHANLSLKVANHDHVEQLFLAEVWGFPKGSKPLVCDCFQVQKLRKRDTWRRHPVDTTWHHLATWLQSSRWCWDSAWLSSLCRLLRWYTDDILNHPTIVAIFNGSAWKWQSRKRRNSQCFKVTRTWMGFGWIRGSTARDSDPPQLFFFQNWRCFSKVMFFFFNLSKFV